MAQTALKSCQARSEDLSTPCTKTFRGEGLFCHQHGREYAVATAKYKSLSETTKQLELAPLSRRDIHALDRRGLSFSISATERYLLALTAEFAARKRHHQQFFGKVDTGHGKWLALLKKKYNAASSQLDALNAHKRTLTGGWHTVKESGLVGFSDPDWNWNTMSEDRAAPNLAIMISCLVMLGLILWAMPSQIRSMLWSYLRNIPTLVPPVVRTLLSIAASVVRFLWAFLVLFCILLWNTVSLSFHVFLNFTRLGL
ncbi:hypothetical protein BC628DRAFT_1392480 [Trametes gibbosa]|nr:hypothetical protein BC628DRAFT_1392480 [Trametes gibbosa]